MSLFQSLHSCLYFSLPSQYWVSSFFSVTYSSSHIPDPFNLLLLLKIFNLFSAVSSLNSLPPSILHDFLTLGIFYIQAANVATTFVTSFSYAFTPSSLRFLPLHILSSLSVFDSASFSFLGCSLHVPCSLPVWHTTSQNFFAYSLISHGRTFSLSMLRHKLSFRIFSLIRLTCAVSFFHSPLISCLNSLSSFSISAF